MCSEEWLLIERPAGDEEPGGYWLHTASADATLEQLVFVAKMRWGIGRDYRELKQEFGLSHYECRNWRGFHYRSHAAHRGLWLSDRPSSGLPRR